MTKGVDSEPSAPAPGFPQGRPDGARPCAGGPDGLKANGPAVAAGAAREAVRRRRRGRPTSGKEDEG